jgi:AcrR family transcriptional regulator
MPYSPNHKQDTRRRILRSAARLFNRRGFSEATIDEIMTAAGLTHGGFYRHFSSKDKLYAEAVRHFLCTSCVMMPLSLGRGRLRMCAKRAGPSRGLLSTLTSLTIT